MMATEEAKSRDSFASQPELILVTQQQLPDSGLSEYASSLPFWMCSVWLFSEDVLFDASGQSGTALHRAAVIGCVVIVEILLDAGPGFTGSYCLKTTSLCSPLHCAAQRKFDFRSISGGGDNETKCNAAVIRALVKVGFSSSDEDSRGATGFHGAA